MTVVKQIFYIFFAEHCALKCVMLNMCFKTNGKGSEDSQLSYRQQVIRALVQRYIESARREFEETKRKGNRDHDTDLSALDSQTVLRSPAGSQTCTVTCCPLSLLHLSNIFLLLAIR